MQTRNTLFDEVFAHWYDVRRGLVQEVKVLPPSRFSFRATLDTRSVADILQHVLEVAITTVEELVRDDTNLHRGTLAQLVNIYAPNISRADTQEKLLDILAEQYSDAETRLRAKGELWMLQLATLRDGSSGTRLTALYDAISHEMYHRGQLTVYTRLLGLVPAVTIDTPRPPLPSFTDRV